MTNPRLRNYVQERLSGRLTTEDGMVVEGPWVPFTGRNRARRADRRWGKAWSPEQISARLRLDHPDDTTMRISPEAIYRGLYIDGRGALDREHVACLRTGRALRIPRARTRRERRNNRGFITPDVTIGRRPTEVEDRVASGPVILNAAPALAVPVGHPLARRGWATLEDLGDCAILDADGVLPAETIEELMPRFTPTGRPIQRRFREGRMAEVFSLVARGQVVHPTVTSAEDHYAHPAVVLVPLRDAPRRRTALVWAAERPNPALRALAAIADDLLADGPADQRSGGPVDNSGPSLQ